MKEKLDKFLEDLAPKLDAFFEAPGKAFFATLNKLFEYTYRETTKGIYGLFDTPEKISKAAKATFAKGYTNFDCLTPFPVHGLEFDMGLKRSKIPWITFFAGLTGLAIAFGLQLVVHEQVLPRIFPYFDGFPNFRSYPLNIGGKPTFAWPAMVPILFELTVLVGGHTTVAGLILLAGMYNPFRKPLHPEITNDQFCLWIPADSANYDEAGVAAFMKELGAAEITKVDGDDQSPAGGAAAPESAGESSPA
ncbi:MAG: DUF3341 domain-containing protein [bacterium]|nr:DUF3341 domain-containing protein [bacterium]